MILLARRVRECNGSARPTNTTTFRDLLGIMRFEYVPVRIFAEAIYLAKEETERRLQEEIEGKERMLLATTRRTLFLPG